MVTVIVLTRGAINMALINLSSQNESIKLLPRSIKKLRECPTIYIWQIL